MNKQDIKLGIIGLGSIGLRHINELIELGIEKVYALRTNKGNKTIAEKVKPFVTDVFSEEEFLALDLDGYIISNPTSLHIDAINMVAVKNKPLFIEKPLCDSLSEIDSIQHLDHGLLQFGYCLRFNQLFVRVKEIIESNQLGKIYHSRINVGQYLPSWHPYTDYREEYFAKKELGGGALRTLSHEIDLAIYFFGLPTKSTSLTAHTSSLEIDVDDYALLLLSYGKMHISRIEIDFLSKKKERKGVVFGELADLHYDLFENTIYLYDPEGNEIKKEVIEENNMYQQQMVAFLEFIQSKKCQGSTWEENIQIMKIIENEKLI